MAKNSIVNVLGFMTILLLASACAKSQPQTISISAKPVEKPELVLPKADKVQARSVEWFLITPSNYQEVFDKISKSGKPQVLFGVTDKGYENLALNLSDIRSLIQQQQAIIVAYEGYYKDSNSAIEAANLEITRAAEEAKLAVDKSQSTGLNKLNPFK